MGTLSTPSARVVFCFSEGNLVLELPVSNGTLFENGVVAPARRAFPLRDKYTIRVAGPMRISISIAGGLPRDSVDRYVRELPHDLAHAARQYLSGGQS